MNDKQHKHASLTLLLGTLITDPQGRVQGRLKDVAVATGPAAGNVAGLLLKTREGTRLVAVKDICAYCVAAFVCISGLHYSIVVSRRLHAGG